MSDQLATWSITILCSFMLLLHSLPFGYLHCSNLWCIVSKFITDICNDLLTCSEWNETSLFLPHADKLTPPSFLSDKISVLPTLPADITIPVSSTG